MQFIKMNLIAPLLDAIRAVGYETPTPIQESTIPLVLSGKDVLGCAQTGTGKTAAFSLPILQLLNNSTPADRSPNALRPIRSLILAPTRELAMQTYENLRQYGNKLPLRTAVIFGGVSQVNQIKVLKGGVDILVATPGRLCDLINQGFIKLNALEIFVLDEADRMLDMGFIHDVKRIIALLPRQKQTLFFSATMPIEVESLAMGLLKNPETVKIDPPTSTVDRIDQCVYLVDKSNKNDLLLDLLNNQGVSSALVFTRTKHGADQVVHHLEKHGIKAMAIHGNKSQGARQSALNAFKTGKISVLVATDIAARGIDISELPFVINYNISEEAETYIHRIGRTGRAGAVGVAISFCCSDELSNLRNIEKLIQKSIPEKECAWTVPNMAPTFNRTPKKVSTHRSTICTIKGRRSGNRRRN